MSKKTKGKSLELKCPSGKVLSIELREKKLLFPNGKEIAIEVACDKASTKKDNPIVNAGADPRALRCYADKDNKSNELMDTQIAEFRRKYGYIDADTDK